MAKNEQFDESVSKWLEESAPARIPERVLDATFERTRRSRQHGGWRALLGRLSMPKFLPALGSAAVIVLVAALALSVYVNRQTGIGALPSASPSASPTVAPPTSEPPTTSGSMWPQSTLEEVRQAQELADAGDPDYTWQVGVQLTEDDPWRHVDELELVDRFIREVLGWEAYSFNGWEGGDFNVSAGGSDGWVDGALTDQRYLRCTPGRTNPLYPGDSCAPTLDDRRYESVSLDLAQLARQGRHGIWVVSRWHMTAPFAQADPVVVEAQASERLEEFLAARVAGNVQVDSGLVDVPLLYATSAGAPYERYEIERVSAPRWPYGEMEFNVRLFAEAGETVVEQLIYLFHLDGRLTLRHDAKQTTENGQAVPVPYSFFDGEVTVFAPDPWDIAWFDANALVQNGQQEGGVLYLMGDPFPVAGGCARGPAPADADTLAQSIQSDPDLVATAPVRVSVGGVEGLAMNVTAASGAESCSDLPGSVVFTPDYVGSRGDLRLSPTTKLRLIMLDAPAGSSMQILVIAIEAPESRFETATEAAAPIVDSIEFHAK